MKRVREVCVGLLRVGLVEDADGFGYEVERIVSGESGDVYVRVAHGRGFSDIGTAESWARKAAVAVVMEAERC